MSLWKKISLGVLIFIVVLLASVAFLVGTPTGLHLVFSAANRWVPGAGDWAGHRRLAGLIVKKYPL
ncbi:Uncharacterized protein YtfN [Salmonella enterica subsp. enterica]|nr:Uncharacterized protein YtfN [Salmonella enterica subsp. enterica]